MCALPEDWYIKELYARFVIFKNLMRSILLITFAVGAFAAPAGDQFENSCEQTRRQYYRPAKQTLVSWFKSAFSTMHKQYNHHLAPHVDMCVEKTKCFEGKLAELIDSNMERLIVEHKGLSDKMETLKDLMANAPDQAREQYQQQYDIFKQKYDALGYQVKVKMGEILDGCPWDESDDESVIDYESDFPLSTADEDGLYNSPLSECPDPILFTINMMLHHQSSTFDRRGNLVAPWYRFL